MQLFDRPYKLEFTSPKYYWQSVLYTGTIQAKWLDGTPYRYPRVDIDIHREDWRLTRDQFSKFRRYRSGSTELEKFKVLIFHSIKVGDKNGNIEFQVSECAVLSPHEI